MLVLELLLLLYMTLSSPCVQAPATRQGPMRTPGSGVPGERLILLAPLPVIGLPVGGLRALHTGSRVAGPCRRRRNRELLGERGTGLC